MKKENPSADLEQVTPETEEQIVKADKQPEVKKSKETKEKLQGKARTKKIINTVINVVLIIAIVVAIICTYISFVMSSGSGVPSFFGLRLLAIQTDSMKPPATASNPDGGFAAGDLIIATACEPEDLRQEDVITYWTVINGERVLNTHRIVNIYDGGGFLIFETKGDANTSADPLTVHEREIVGKWNGFKLKGVGKAIDYLQTPTGFFIVVVIPVLVFFLYHLVQFFRVLFEYQNTKNRLKYEQERGRAEDMIAAHQQEEQKKEAERAAMEAELREKLRAEIMASMEAEKKSENNPE